MPLRFTRKLFPFAFQRFNIIQKADPGYPTMRSTLGSSVLVKISRPNDCGSTSPLPLQNLSEGQKKLRKRHEKTVIILILIVLVFLICHSFRLGVQTYQVNTFQANLLESIFLPNEKFDLLKTFPHVFCTFLYRNFSHHKIFFRH